MDVEVVNFSPYRKGPTYQGLLDVRLPTIGLEIRSIGLHERQGKRWLQLPVRRYTREDGVVKLANFLFFYPNSNYKQFQRAALEALDSFLGSNNGGQSDEREQKH